MTPPAWGDGSLSLRCGDLLYLPKIVPLEFLWKLGLSTKHELHEWSTQWGNSYAVCAFFPPCIQHLSVV